MTWEDIGPEARAAATGWLESERERGHPIPEPKTKEPDETWPQGMGVEPSTSPEPELLLGVADVARILEISPRRVQALARHRGLGRKIGTSLAFTSADIDKMRVRRPGRPPATADKHAMAAD